MNSNSQQRQVADQLSQTLAASHAQAAGSTEGIRQYQTPYRKRIQ